MNHKRIAPTFLVVTLTCLQLGCRQDQSAAASAMEKNGRTLDKAGQSALTPSQALARLKEGNARFVRDASTMQDYPAQVKATASGQYPFAVILACMDSRSAPEVLFDQGIGDLFVERIAGNFATPELIGSAEFGTKVAGAKLVVVMGHSECGAIKGACDKVELGNLTSVITALRPAVDDVKDFQGDRSSHDKKFVQMVAEANVRRTVAKLRSDSAILHELEQSGSIMIVGAMYDISTGEVHFLHE